MNDKRKPAPPVHPLHAWRPDMSSPVAGVPSGITMSDFAEYIMPRLIEAGYQARVVPNPFGEGLALEVAKCA